MIALKHPALPLIERPPLCNLLQTKYVLAWMLRIYHCCDAVRNRRCYSIQCRWVEVCTEHPVLSLCVRRPLLLVGTTLLTGGTVGTKSRDRPRHVPYLVARGRAVSPTPPQRPVSCYSCCGLPGSCVLLLPGSRRRPRAVMTRENRYNRIRAVLLPFFLLLKIDQTLQVRSSPYLWVSTTC